MSLRRLAAPGLLLALITAIGTPVAAQGDRPERPYRGMFGGGQDQSSNDQGSSDAQRLDLHGSTFGAYDANLFRGTGTSEALATDSRFQFSGPSWGATGGLQYSKPSRRVSFGATGDTSLSVYPSLNRALLTGFRGGVDLTAPLGRLSRFHAGQNVGYTPFYSPLDTFGLGLNPEILSLGQVGADALGIGSTGPNSVNYSGYRSNGFTSDTSAGLTHSFSSRSSFSAEYGLQLVSFSDHAADLKAHTAGGRFQRNLTKSLSLRLGYSYWQGEFGRGDQRHLTRWHNVDAGVDYQKALSISRRTKVKFGLGSAIVASQYGNLYHLIGKANLDHEIGRTWIAEIVYDRNVQLVRGFSDPFLLDSLGARLNGLINRRLGFRATATYSSGTVGFGPGKNGVTSYLGSARVSFALSRRLATYGEYFYYHDNFGLGVQLPLGFTPVLDRRGDHGGLSLWLPLLDRRTASNRRP